MQEELSSLGIYESRLTRCARPTHDPYTHNAQRDSSEGNYKWVVTIAHRTSHQTDPAACHSFNSPRNALMPRPASVPSRSRRARSAWTAGRLPCQHPASAPPLLPACDPRSNHTHMSPLPPSPSRLPTPRMSPHPVPRPAPPPPSSPPPIPRRRRTFGSRRRPHPSRSFRRRR